MKERFTTFYLDKERDIEINLYKEYLALDKQVPENLRPQKDQVPKNLRPQMDPNVTMAQKEE